jgi:hypothetical protein
MSRIEGPNIGEEGRVSMRGAARFACLLVAAGMACGALVGSAAAAPSAAPVPDFGPNVKIFDPGMSTAQIKSTVDAIAAQQVPNQFGTQRYALLFMPGTYGSTADPLNFQVGYYTEVAGLGALPDGVTVNGAVNTFDQCDAANFCTALTNFWRSLSNLTINQRSTPTPAAKAPQSSGPPRRPPPSAVST